jgi:uncharacterized membrane protein YgcG
MEKLFDDDPQYYFKTLPYAWAFNLSSIWAQKFTGMITTPPSWYNGYYENDTFTAEHMQDSMSRLHSASIKSFREPLPKVSSSGGSSGSSSSSGSGGSSSGGGSSGGGFGGGGGGRW